MRKHRIILTICISIVFVIFAASFFTPSIITHLFYHSKKKIIHSPEDVENTLLELKSQKQELNAPHIVFKISRKPRLTWDGFFNWKSAGAGYSWTQGDRLIEFSNVGGTLVYSIPIRWRENSSAGSVVFETETNVSPSLSGTEIYSTSDQEFKRLNSFLAARTPDVELSCSISKDAVGRIIEDHEYLDGTFSIPQNEWADFIQSLFKEAYNSNQPIYVEQIQLRAFGLF
jgi:hypothetical protein